MPRGHTILQITTKIDLDPTNGDTSSVLTLYLPNMGSKNCCPTRNMSQAGSSDKRNCFLRSEYSLGSKNIQELNKEWNELFENWTKTTTIHQQCIVRTADETSSKTTGAKGKLPELPGAWAEPSACSLRNRRLSVLRSV